MTEGRTVVVLPGGAFGPAVPQLFLPMIAAMRRGAEPRLVEWRGIDGVPERDRTRLMRQQAAAALLDASPGVVVGKSLGSHAAGEVADAGLPAIWVTPLLTERTVVRALERATAPFLLVGGTGDELWHGGLARSLTPHVLELPGADHGLFVPGPLGRSAANLGRLADTSEAFLDEVVWPPEA